MQRVSSTGHAARPVHAGAVPAARTFGLAAVGLVVWLILGAAAAAVAQAAPGDALDWLDDYQEALARARETGQPLLVEFRCAP